MTLTIPDAAAVAPAMLELGGEVFREVGEAELCAFVAAQVAHHKQIRRLTFVEAIPKSASGKILRRVLRDQG